MGEVLHFDRSSSSRSGNPEISSAPRGDIGLPSPASESDLGRQRARYYIASAAAILSRIGEPERRVSWLLEDCAGLLADREQHTLK